jgi:hypothetical protein
MAFTAEAIDPCAVINARGEFHRYDRPGCKLL